MSSTLKLSPRKNPSAILIPLGMTLALAILFISSSCAPIESGPETIPGLIKVTETALPTVEIVAASETPASETPAPATPALEDTATALPPSDTPTLTPSETPTASPEPPTLTPTATPVPWWQVYFVTPLKFGDKDETAYATNGLPASIYTGSIVEKLVQRIDAAQTSIHIASFETDLLEVTQALIRAQQRGVDVRWITDDEAGTAKDSQPGHGKFKLLTDAGIGVIDDKRGGLMHDKFWIFDSATVWTGSTNVTVSGAIKQNNNVIVIESPELAAIYERQWADMWSGKFNSKSPSTVDQQKLTIKDTNIQVLFSPEDKAIEKLIPYVQNAQSSIYFMAFTYTQPQLGQAMLQAAQRNVVVTGVFETLGSDSNYSQLKPLFCANLPVRQDGNPEFLHHKVIIIDERYVVTGSLNFTDNASQTNNENVIILDNPEIARLYLEEFQRVWQIAKNPDPVKIKCQ